MQAFDSVKQTAAKQGTQVKLVLEQIPPGEWVELANKKDLLDGLQLQTEVLTEKGRFDQALKPFQQLIEILAASSPSREQRIVDMAQDYAKDPQTAGVVVLFGTAHTGIPKGLVEHGIAVKRVYPERKGSFLYFDPVEALVRKHMFQGPESISEIDWYRGLFGKAMLVFTENMMQAMAEQSGEPSDFDDQEFIPILYKEIQAMSIEQIKEVEALIRQKGHFQAFVDFLQLDKED